MQASASAAGLFAGAILKSDGALRNTARRHLICMRPRRGVTLIELLVVISIIAILMSLFLPALSKARRQAAKLKCETQMNQLAAAVRAYERDFERLPPRSRLPSVDPQSLPLPFALMRYVGERPKMFACPDDVADFSERPPPNEGRSFVESEQASYSYTPTAFGLVTFDGVAEYESFHTGAGR